MTYAACLDEARQIYAERSAHGRQVSRMAGDVTRADVARLARSIAAQHAMAEHITARLEKLAAIGRILAAVAEAHARDPEALAAVIGNPLSNQ